MHQIQGLQDHPLRKKLIHHEFFQNIDAAPLSKEGVTTLLGQWWHPLHYFPTFLSRAIAIITQLEMKTAVSAILFQELGEGSPAKAHENIYIETMVAAGFSQNDVCSAEPFPSTAKLLAGYEKASGDRWEALGFIYGTEVADLAMVSGIGKAVRKVTSKQGLPWVDIHVLQEPGHVNQATLATQGAFSVAEERQILASAEEMWKLWIAFFTTLQNRIWKNSSAVLAQAN